MEMTWETMGMDAKLQVVGEGDIAKILVQIKQLYRELDEKFSTYKTESEISRYNRHGPSMSLSREMQFILTECERTKRETQGYFDCHYGTLVDPAGLVKGYAISQAAKLLRSAGYQDFLVEIAGDVQTSGLSEEGEPWKIGIENPFNRQELIKVVGLAGQAIATSGTSIHPNHIIDPLTHKVADQIASVSIVAEDIYDADRMATAAFAMGESGIEFIQKLPGYAGYMVLNNKQALMTESFKQYVK